MKCPVCVLIGERSSLTEYPGLSTLMYADAYYDEDGEHHYHDPNSHTTGYRCSNGHMFTVTRYHACSSCDYGGTEKIFIRDWASAIPNQPMSPRRWLQQAH